MSSHTLSIISPDTYTWILALCWVWGDSPWEAWKLDINQQALQALITRYLWSWYCMDDEGDIHLSHLFLQTQLGVAREQANSFTYIRKLVLRYPSFFTPQEKILLAWSHVIMYYMKTYFATGALSKECVFRNEFCSSNIQVSRQHVAQWLFLPVEINIVH